MVKTMTNKIDMITIPYRFEPRGYQLDIFKAMDAGKKRILMRWSRRAGKDLTCWNVMIKEAFKKQGLYFYTFPEYSQAKKAVWEAATKPPNPVKFLEFIPPQWIKSKNSNELKVELFNGSIIRLVGTENIDSLMGTNPLGVVFSEFSIQKLQAWEYIQPILMENGGWAIFNGTPRGKNHMYEMEATNQDNKEWFISEVQSLWPDLPNYYPVASQEVIEAARKTGYTEEMIEQEFGVSYIAGQKGAYYMDCITAARNEGRIGEFMYDNHKYVDTFWDLGITDDTVIWFRQIINNKLVFIDYYENNTKDLAHYVQILKEKGYRYRTHYLPHDGHSRSIQTSMSNSQIFRRLLQEANISADVYCAQCPSQKQLAINLVRSRFSRYCFDSVKCAEGIKKLSLYHRQYDRGTKSFRDYPAHDWTSHAADALSTEGLTGEISEDFMQINPSNIITDFDPGETHDFDPRDR